LIQESIADSQLLVQIGAYVAGVLALGGFVWLSLKGLSMKLDKDMPPGKKRHRIKLLASWLLGPVFGIVFYKIGFLPVPGSEFWGLLAAALFGLFGTLGASWQHGRSKKKAAEPKKKGLP